MFVLLGCDWARERERYKRNREKVRRKEEDTKFLGYCDIYISTPKLVYKEGTMLTPQTKHRFSLAFQERPQSYTLGPSY
jgi:hypothetical protein